MNLGKQIKNFLDFIVSLEGNMNSILLVEDDEAILQSLSEFLQREGYQVDRAEG